MDRKTIFIAAIFLILAHVYGLKIELYHKSHPTHVALMQATMGELGTFGSEFVVHFTMGTPPVKTFAVFDTGSHLFWMQTSTCDPCLHQPQETNHDLEASSSLQVVQCFDEACKMTPHLETECQKPRTNCDYLVGYGDDTESLGYLATDIFTFSDGSPPVSLLVGVGTRNFRSSVDDETGLFDFPGVFGLGKLSSYQLDNMFKTEQFSYCIPSFDTNNNSNNNNNKTGYLHFGEEVEWTGPVSDMGEDPFFIYLTLDRIELNGKPILNPGAPEGEDSDWSEYQIMMDTRAPSSHFVTMIFEALLDEFESLLGSSFEHESRNCWFGMSSERLDSITLTLYFGNIAFKLYRPQIWDLNHHESSACLYFKEEKEMDSTLGILQTTNKNIAISYPTNEIAIVERNC